MCECVGVAGDYMMTVVPHQSMLATGKLVCVFTGIHSQYWLTPFLEQFYCDSATLPFRYLPPVSPTVP